MCMIAAWQRCGWVEILCFDWFDAMEPRPYHWRPKLVDTSVSKWPIHEKFEGESIKGFQSDKTENTALKLNFARTSRAVSLLESQNYCCLWRVLGHFHIRWAAFCWTNNVMHKVPCIFTQTHEAIFMKNSLSNIRAHINCILTPSTSKPKIFEPKGI